ncbi:MAG: hypothetical protein HDR36_03380 [Treponema sp.]|nr:hypothetical protein [Treponema sp.]
MANSLPAFSNDEFAVINSLSALDNNEFGVTNSMSSLDKHEFGATNSFPSLNKYEFGATNSFPALDNNEFVVTNSSSTLEKYEFCAQDASAGLYAYASTHLESTVARVAAEQNSKGLMIKARTDGADFYHVKFPLETCIFNAHSHCVANVRKNVNKKVATFLLTFYRSFL